MAPTGSGPARRPRPRHLELFLELARIDATSGREAAVARRLRELLEPLGLALHEDGAAQAVGGDSGNLICRVGDGGDLLLLAHMDTARPTAELRPLVGEDRVTSDGTTILGADDRVGVATLVHTLERIVRERLPVRGFTVAFTVCEERDLGGSRHLELPPGVTMAACFDSSLRPGSFIHRSYGASRFVAEIRGRAAHAGLAPEQGINAILVASRALAGLSFGRLDEETTANVGAIAGGGPTNVVPDRVEVEGEVRSLRISGVERVLHDVEDAFQRAARTAGASLRFSSHWEFEPFALPPDAAVCRRVAAALERAGLEPLPCVSAGGSDANSLNARGIPAVNLGVGAQRPHSNEELVLLEDLAATADLALELVRE